MTLSKREQELKDMAEHVANDFYDHILTNYFKVANPFPVELLIMEAKRHQMECETFAALMATLLCRGKFELIHNSDLGACFKATSLPLVSSEKIKLKADTYQDQPIQ